MATTGDRTAPAGPWLPLALATALATAAAMACGGGTTPPGTTAPSGGAQGAPATTPHPKEGSQGTRRALSAQERYLFEKLFAEAETIRGLRFTRPVPVEVHDRRAVEAYVEAQIAKEHLDDDTLLYVTLGLLPANMDVKAMLVSLMGEQIVGYYDTDRALFVVRDEVMTTMNAGAGGLDESRIVIIHEMVHALQDQHLGLGKRFPKDEDSDVEHAYQAVVEGDASLAMLGAVTAQMGAPLDALTQNGELLDGLMQNASAMPNQDELGQAPAIVRVPLMWAYLEGMRFCVAAHGQSGWRGVNALHGRVPASTEQVLHPEKYARGEAPVPVTLPALPELTAAGWAPVKEDTLGELELSIYLAGPHADQDAAAAAGWGGDRLRLYRHTDGRGATLWLTAWDTERDAREAEVAARRRKGVVLRRGKRVGIAHGLDAPHAEKAVARLLGGPSD